MGQRNITLCGSPPTLRSAPRGAALRSCAAVRVAVLFVLLPRFDIMLDVSTSARWLGHDPRRPDPLPAITAQPRKQRQYPMLSLPTAPYLSLYRRLWRRTRDITQPAFGHTLRGGEEREFKGRATSKWGVSSFVSGRKTARTTSATNPSPARLTNPAECPK